MTRVTAYNLRRILDQTAEHQPKYGDTPNIYGVHLDADGKQLHAVASDRYTLAVSRAPLTEAAQTPWAHTIPAPFAKTLRQWISDLEAHDEITINVDGEGDTAILTFTIQGTALMTRPAPGTFPKWRGMLAQALANTDGHPATGITTTISSRWASGEHTVSAWHSGDTKPIVYVGDQFVGIQMPLKNREHSAYLAGWQADLTGAEPLDPAQELRDPTDTKNNRDYVEYFLTCATTGTHDLAEAEHDSPRFYQAVHELNTAWAAFRLLQALREVSPDAAEKALRALDAELDSGDFAELIPDYAAEAGHDTEKWISDYETSMQQAAARCEARKAEESAAAPAE